MISPLPSGPFATILADPPWRYSDRATRAAAEDHYQTMSDREIIRMPVEDIAAKDSSLYLWVTAAHLPVGLEVMKQWGFTFKQYLVWIKAKDGKLQMGMGHYWRHATELVLFGTRGKAPVLAHDQLNVFWAPREEHSRKPAILHELIERVSGGPYLELFSRCERPGWTSWGNEVGKFSHANQDLQVQAGVLGESPQ